MNKQKFLGLLCVLAVVMLSHSAFALDISPLNGHTPYELAQNIVGSGITISNVSFTGAHDAPSGAYSSAGFFSDGFASGIGIDSGIVLTSGYAMNIDGTSNTSDGITGALGLPGDSDLNSLIPGYYLRCHYPRVRFCQCRRCSLF